MCVCVLFPLLSLCLRRHSAAVDVERRGPVAAEWPATLACLTFRDIGIPCSPQLQQRCSELAVPAGHSWIWCV